MFRKTALVMVVMRVLSLSSMTFDLGLLTTQLSNKEAKYLSSSKHIK